MSGAWLSPATVTAVPPVPRWTGPAGPGLLEAVRRRLVDTGAAVTPAAVAAAVRREGLVLDDEQLLAVVEQLHRDLAGAGPLEALLADDLVTDVLVDGNGSVWVDRGQGLERSEVRLGDAAAVRRLAVRLASTAGRRLDDAAPFVDARLANGCRLHAVLPPLAVDGPLLSLRVPPRRPFSLERLVRAGSVTPTVARLLQGLLAARAAFLVTGGTGTGKTTVLAALLGLVPPRERVVIVEDCTELVPDHPHVVRLEARPPNVEGAGAVDVRTLVQQALRMRPDRLVVGEARGPEVVDLLAALNTGHEGGCGTVHANSPRDLPARLVALAAPAGPHAGSAVLAQARAGLHAVVHLARTPDGRRVVDQLGAVDAGPDGQLAVVPAFDRSGQPLAGAPLLRRWLPGSA